MAGSIWDELETEQEPAEEESFHDVPPSLLECIPGDLFWNDCGSVYVSARSNPIGASEQPEDLTHNPSLPPRQLASLSRTTNFRQSGPGRLRHSGQKTKGIGSNDMLFMTGEGPFEAHAPQEIDTRKNRSSSSLPSEPSQKYHKRGPRHTS